MNKLRNLQDRRVKLGGIPGFTIVELLIAVLLATLISSAAMVLYLTQQKQLLVQNDVTDMQSGMRAATMELTSRLRMAGYKLPEGFQCIITSNTDPDTIEVVTNSSLLGDDVQIEWSMPQPSSELRCDGHDISAVRDGDTIYIYDPFAMFGESFPVSHVQYSSSNIQHNTQQLSRRYPKGSKIFKLVTYKYYIDNTDPNHPSLVYKVNHEAPQVYAENITNLNFQYVLSSGDIVDTAPRAYMIREALITIGGRTDKIDSEFFAPYRNRTLTTRIKIRNLGDNR